MESNGRLWNLMESYRRIWKVLADQVTRIVIEHSRIVVGYINPISVARAPSFNLLGFPLSTSG